ncbi:hypothetical protein H2200_002823 [Cladophialophora chaetospira]|uniref:Chloramphenicol phosphotransferase-like protein n=1 Tax=Cladophialophora chaetospira TaxID=386627 RepID=A0AA38XGC4_9EURO|nr:hypothetical protein H2200_002823 [Cladophialophora chaetospira]
MEMLGTDSRLNGEAPSNKATTNSTTPPQKLYEGKVVVLNGFPGAGKLTILKRAKELLPTTHTRLLDNHLLIDPVSAVIPDRSKEHHELRRKVRAPIFEVIRKLALEGHVILMMACLAEGNDTDAAFCQEHLDIVHGTDVPLFWFNAQCDQDILEERVKSPERCQGTKTKLTDVNVVRKLLRENRLIEPQRSVDEHLKLIVETLDVSGELDDSVRHLMNLVCFMQSNDQI